MIELYKIMGHSQVLPNNTASSFVDQVHMAWEGARSHQAPSLQVSGPSPSGYGYHKQVIVAAMTQDPRILQAIFPNAADRLSFNTFINNAVARAVELSATAPQLPGNLQVYNLFADSALF